MNDMTWTMKTIPWQRLTTAYGRGTEIPQLIANKHYRTITDLIEHQGTLWQVTPWVLLVLLQELAEKEPEEVTTEEINLYLVVAAVIDKEELETGKTVTTMDELINEKYLWPVDEEEDDFYWGNDEARGYDSQAFLSYYYFSYRLLQEAIPVFKKLLEQQRQEATVKAIAQLLALLIP